MSVLILKYRSGEEIKKGDRVLFHGNPAEVELVAFDPNEPEHVWYVQEFGSGVMILDRIVSGRTFIATDQLKRLRGFGICRVRESNWRNTAIALGTGILTVTP
jgi:hypothetical protein